MPADRVTEPAEALAATLAEALAEAAAATPSSPGQVLWVLSPRTGLDLGVAVGSADLSSGEALTPRHTVRVASIGKSFTALAALRLVEGGRVGLDDGLTVALLGEEMWELLTGRGYDPAAITLRHLLGHVSGLPDYAEQADGAYVAAVLADPGRAWRPEEQVAFALEHYASAGRPGERFAYSDTGYLLVGRIIERLTGVSLAVAVRDLVDLEGAGLSDTYLELLEPPSSQAPRATQYAGDLDLTHEVSPTVDLYGGGGQVSSMRDVAHFYRRLGTGGAFASSSTLAVMQAAVSDSEPTAGLGLFSFDIAQRRFLGHGGTWGLLAGYCPELDLAFAHTWNQMLVDDLAPVSRVRVLLVGRLAERLS